MRDAPTEHVGRADVARQRHVGGGGTHGGERGVVRRAYAVRRETRAHSLRDGATLPPFVNVAEPVGVATVARGMTAERPWASMAACTLAACSSAPAAVHALRRLW